ncbi:HupE/UreJ family protein [Curvibacter sp. APW13]|uniref:HupE/UreJ family protein n=1 Tax=Curvibacter sp. APW13 TaxID=3077236 RepID=UPI0028DE237A|nr:HupE/UreJ family protein [Curvibacter sp. APW13]MDT8990796.1 HupE/UreJ family protein [Curvibacter sp. APW13]
MYKKPTNALFFIAACAISTVASAHIGTQEHVHASFMAGLLHPWLGTDHLLAMLAVGAWSALVAQRLDSTLLRGPLAFANLLLLGALLGLQGVASPAVEPLVAASVLVLGLLVLARHALGGVASIVLAGGFALFHGLAHGAEFAAAADPVLAIAGMVVGTLGLHAIGLALGWALRSSPWGRRIAGGAVAASGLGLLLQLG